jgi:ribosomal protein L37AE/L43A
MPAPLFVSQLSISSAVIGPCCSQAASRRNQQQRNEQSAAELASVKARQALESVAEAVSPVIGQTGDAAPGDSASLADAPDASQELMEEGYLADGGDDCDPGPYLDEDTDALTMTSASLSRDGIRRGTKGPAAVSRTPGATAVEEGRRLAPRERSQRYRDLYASYASHKESLKQLLLQRAGLEAAMQDLKLTQELGVTNEVDDECLLRRAKTLAHVMLCKECGEALTGGAVHVHGQHVRLVSLSCAPGSKAKQPAHRCPKCQSTQFLHPILLGCFPCNPAASIEAGGLWFDQDVLVAGQALRRHGHYAFQAWSHVVQDVQCFRQGGGSSGCTKYSDMRDLTLVRQRFTPLYVYEARVW